MDKTKVVVLLFAFLLIPIIYTSIRHISQEPNSENTIGTWRIATEEEMKPLYEQKAKEIANGTYDKYFAPSPPTIEFQKNIPSGFRKFKWGEVIKIHRNNTPVKKDKLNENYIEKISEEGRELYSRMDISPSALCSSEYEYDVYRLPFEKLKIGDAELISIKYYCTPETGLLRVDIQYCNKNEYDKNIEKVEEYFQSRWGRNPYIDSWNKTQNSTHIAEWHSEKIKATIYISDHIFDIRRLSIVSIPLTKKYAMLWNNNLTIAQKERKIKYDKAVSNDF